MNFTISEKTAAAVCNTIREYDEKSETRYSYSGRGMFGAECVGWVVSNISLVVPAFTQVLTDEGEIEFNAMDIAAEAHIDNMGLDWIVYFPSIRVNR